MQTYPEVLRLDDDPGFMTVELFGGPQKQLDVFEQNNRLAELDKATQGQPAHVLHGAVAAHLQQVLGLESPPSHAIASRFIEAVTDRVEDVKKKLAGPPTSLSPSPASTRSPYVESNGQLSSLTLPEPVRADGLLTNLSPIPVSELV